MNYNGFSPIWTGLTLQGDVGNEIFTVFLCNFTYCSRWHFSHLEMTGYVL